MDDFRLARPAGQQPDLFGFEQMFQAHGHAPRWRLRVGQVPPRCFDGGGVQHHAVCGRGGGRARFVHAQVTVQTHAEQGQVKASPNRLVVAEAFRLQVLRPGVEEVKSFRGQINMIDQATTKLLDTKSGIAGGQTAEFIQREHFGLAKRYLPVRDVFSHRRENTRRGMARRQAEAKAGVGAEAVAPPAGDVVRPGDFRIEFLDIHGNRNGSDAVWQHSSQWFTRARDQSVSRPSRGTAT